MLTIISFILVLGIIVFIHELGHFTAAKLTKMRVETFSIGFGKKLISKKMGETEYQIALIPLGGYVKISGMVDESLDPTGGIKGEDYEFESKNFFQKAFFISAGVIMNFLLAIVIYTFSTYSTGIPVATSKITKVREGFPAAQMNIMAGDSILEVNNKSFATGSEYAKYIAKKIDGKALEIKLLRNGSILTKKITPKVVEYPDIKNDLQLLKRGLIGIELNIIQQQISFFESFIEALKTTKNLTDMGIISLKLLITGKASLKELGGPIMIAKMSGESAKHGIHSLLLFIAFISINIGFLNILPIPMLDGGHLVYIIIEAIIRRRINTEIKYKIQVIGFLLVMSLSIFAIFNDIARISSPATDTKDTKYLENKAKPNKDR